jgi:hypothetical protein
LGALFPLNKGMRYKLSDFHISRWYDSVSLARFDVASGNRSDLPHAL